MDHQLQGFKYVSLMLKLVIFIYSQNITLLLLTGMLEKSQDE